MNFISLQPFESGPHRENRVPVAAKSRWKSASDDEIVALGTLEKLLLFAPQNRDESARGEWNFLLTPLGNPLFNPPARAYETLGEAKTLELFFRRAISNGSFGRFFVFGPWIVVLNANARHLVAHFEHQKSGKNREWTPFEWSEMDAKTLQTTPSSALFSVVERAWRAENSPLRFARRWNEFDYFERLWQSLAWRNRDADFARQIVRDSVTICPSAWNESHEIVNRWSLGFALHSREPHFDLLPFLQQPRGALTWNFPPEKLGALKRFFAWLGPRRQRPHTLEHLAQREWLDHSGGTSSWNLSVEIERVSAHEQLEAALRLRENLRVWGEENAANWLEIWSR